ncbi:hypothetical protein NLI96_g10826 [Meripilus lineatus]|uniref:Uncharacterized protein n=1 Tax=Meripilus lineatus TaxID=2056292 RepID=A0AAD5USW0_9APHY|nr:hypothetical protein NLI96_g10826 [Physisporinus lineatus]
MVNVPALLVSWLNLNEPMNAMFSPPASTISIMVSSRAVVQLTLDKQHKAEQKAEINDSLHATHRISSNKLSTHVAFPPEVYAHDSREFHASQEDAFDRIDSASDYV